MIICFIWFNIFQQESIPLACVPPVWKPYMLQWQPPDVTPGGRGPQMNKFKRSTVMTTSYHQQGGVPGLMSIGGGGQGWLWYDACTVRSNAPWIMVMWGPTPVKTLPRHNFVGGQ